MRVEAVRAQTNIATEIAHSVDWTEVWRVDVPERACAGQLHVHAELADTGKGNSWEHAFAEIRVIGETIGAQVLVTQAAASAGVPVSVRFPEDELYTRLIVQARLRTDGWDQAWAGVQYGPDKVSVSASALFRVRA